MQEKLEKNERKMREKVRKSVQMSRCTLLQTLFLGRREKERYLCINNSGRAACSPQARKRFVLLNNVCV